MVARSRAVSPVLFSCLLLLAAITAALPASPAAAATYQSSFGSYGFGEGGFQRPADVEVGPDGHIYVVDSSLHLVQEFTRTGQFVDQFGSYGTGNGQLNHPTALAFDPEGDIWIADTGNNRVQQFTSSGEYLSKFGSFGSGYVSYTEGHGKFNGPEGVAVDPEGNVYVADTYNHRIQKFDAEGEFLAIRALVGEVAPEEEIIPNPPFSAHTPTGIAVGPDGNVWFTDHANMFVYRLSSLLEILDTGGQPPGFYSKPDAIDVDPHGNVWIGDERNHRVVELDDEALYQDEFGIWSGFPGGNFDFHHHFGVDADSHNHIWITDPGNYKVQRWVEHDGQAAVCYGESATTGVDEGLELAPGDLGCEGEGSLSYEILGAPEHGEVSEFDPETGELTYTPEAEYHGPDSFTFEATNGLGSDEATFSIEVGEAPSCNERKAQTEIDEPVSISLSCSGDFAASAYEIVRQPIHGELSEFKPGAGTITYTPDLGYRGVDKFTYERSSSVHSSRALVRISMCAPPIVDVAGDLVDPERPGVHLNLFSYQSEWTCAGIAAVRVWVDDELVYSEERNCQAFEWACSGSLNRAIQLPVEKVLGTHDFRAEAVDKYGVEAEPEEWSETTSAVGTLLDPVAEGSKESECATPKVRRQPYPVRNGAVVGTPCADIIAARDHVRAYRGLGGDDRIIGGPGVDRIRGEGGDDTILAGRGNDRIRGEGGNDRLYAGSGDDRLFGRAGNDTMVGGAGADRIFAGEGDDLVRGGTTIDKLFGEGGSDTLSYADGVTPGFFLYPGTHPDVALNTGFPSKHGERGVYVNLAGEKPIGDNGEIARYGGGADEIRADEFDNVIGTPYADLIVGSDEANEIVGGGGTDIIRSRAGADTLLGGADEDLLDGGSDQAAASVNGGGGTDICLNDPESVGCESNEAEGVLHQPEAASITLGLLEAGSASGQKDVYVKGSTAPDHLKAIWGAEGVTVMVTGGGGKFALAGEAPGCTIASETEASCTLGGIDSILLDGGGDADLLEVSGFPKETSVTLLGGAGPDRLVGGGGTEEVLVDGSDAANDRLNGSNGDDTLFVNEGKDILTGGAGDDLFVSAEICDGDVIQGGAGSDNANWAQLVGDEIEAGNDAYPATVKEQIFASPVEHGAKVRIAAKSISRQGKGCEDNGEIRGVENLEGSHGPDVLIGDGSENVILGRSGADVLRGRGGSDRMIANSANEDGDTPAERKDLDRRIECGAGSDSLTMDKTDKRHFKAKGLKGCEPSRARVRPGENFRVAEGSDSLFEGPPGALDEEEIGAPADPAAPSPVAFYRFDESAGTEAVDWADQFDDEEEPELEEESEEDAKEIEAEEVEEAEEEWEGEFEPGEDDPHPGTFHNGAALGEPGALAESDAVKLDGLNDYVDLTDSWDPQALAWYHGNGGFGYTVELWVKFDGAPAGREELFSRAEEGSGLYLYRAADGTIQFSVADPIEAPVVSTDEPVADGSWHHVVASLFLEEEIISFSAEEPDAIAGLTLVVDGFSYTLGVGENGLLPAEMPDAHNLVGARQTEAGLSNWLDGSVDDVAIYGEALRPGDVEAHLAVSDAEQPLLFLDPLPDLTDTDEDGVADGDDNCPEAENAEQEDEDLNGVGDICEATFDGDEDGVIDELDNCPEDQNPLQEDEDEDLVGDVCETEE